jgi:hypothetical protein
MAIPRRASDKNEIDRAMIAGISIPHLKITKIYEFSINKNAVRMEKCKMTLIFFRIDDMLC